MHIAASSRQAFLRGSLAIGTAAAMPRIARAQGTRATIRIGYLDSLSGPFAVGGIPQLNGARLALEDANRRGRARYELVVGDDIDEVVEPVRVRIAGRSHGVGVEPVSCDVPVAAG